MIKKENRLKGIACTVFGIFMVAALFSGTAVAEDVYLNDRYFYYLYDDIPAGITLYSPEGAPVAVTVQDGDKVFIMPLGDMKDTTVTTTGSSSMHTSSSGVASTPPSVATSTAVATPTPELPVTANLDQTRPKKNDTVVPSSPENIPTGKSPVPFIGLMAGLGAAVHLCRQRR